MATMTINSYIHQIESAWENEDGLRVGELLSLQDPHVSSSRLTAEDPEESIRDALEPPLSEMAVCHFQTLRALSRQNVNTALQFQCQLGQLFCKVLQSQKDENWGISIMQKIVEDLRKIAVSVRQVGDTDDRSSEEHAPTGMEKAADVIMALFRVCAADTRTQEQDTKRWGMMNLVNHLFKIYFRINRLQLCKPLIRAIEQQAFKDRFPREEMVTYKYYVGRKAMFDSDFRDADDCLTFAFYNASSKENKRKILTYLIPVKMFLGFLPTQEALRKYDLVEFWDVSSSLKDGNIYKFKTALQKSEAKFIKAGVYLILEKLHMTLYRNLFKKVCLLYKNHQVPIAVLTAALKWAGHEEIDMDETHCIAANLIYDGQLRGYISHLHQVVVIAKQNAFPKISAIEHELK